MKKLIIALLLAAGVAWAEQKLPARMISVESNTWSYLAPVSLTVQSTLDWIDTYLAQLVDEAVRTNDTRQLDLFNAVSSMTVSNVVATNVNASHVNSPDGNFTLVDATTLNATTITGAGEIVSGNIAAGLLTADTIQVTNLDVTGGIYIGGHWRTNLTTAANTFRVSLVTNCTAAFPGYYDVLFDTIGHAGESGSWGSSQGAAFATYDPGATSPGWYILTWSVAMRVTPETEIDPPRYTNAACYSVLRIGSASVAYGTTVLGESTGASVGSGLFYLGPSSSAIGIRIAPWYGSIGVLDVLGSGSVYGAVSISGFLLRAD